MSNGPGENRSGGTVDLSALIVDKRPKERERFVSALAGMGILAVKEMEDQFEALVVTATVPYDLVVYGMIVEEGEPRFAGDLSMLNQSACTVVLTGPLKPALVEFLSPNGKEVGYPLIMGLEPGRPGSPAEFPKNLDLEAQMRVLAVAEPVMPLAAELVAALGRQELHLVYEPLVRPKDNSLAGAHVSLRWIHPEFGLLMPATLAEVATTGEAQEALAHYLFERTLEAQSRLRKEGLSLRLHLNLGPYLKQRGAANQLLGIFLDFAREEPPGIVLDVEESELMASPETVVANVGRLKSKDFEFALAGYAALAHPEQIYGLSLSCVKVNPSQLMRGPHQERLGEIIGMSRGMASEWGLSLVVQGVHRQTEWDLLVSLGCDLAQGRFISQALEYQAFLDWIKALSLASLEPEPEVKAADALDLLLFNYILSVTQDRGISWAQSFRHIRDHNPKASQMLDELEQKLLGGQTLSSAMRGHPEVFSERVVSQVEGAEEVSRLPKVLRRLYERSLAQGQQLGTSPLEVSPLGVAQALEEMADLMDLGLPLTRAVRQAVAGCDQQPVRLGLQELLGQLESEGEENLGSLHYPPKVFSRYAAPFLEVSQAAGCLSVGLRDLAELVKSRKG